MRQPRNDDGMRGATTLAGPDQGWSVQNGG